MEQPTHSQRKAFWKWCGVYQLKEYYGGRMLPIDLNNLFKYAVPKLLEKGKYLHLVIHSLTRFDTKIEDAFGRFLNCKKEEVCFAE